jgi:hypothetical protein
MQCPTKACPTRIVFGLVLSFFTSFGIPTAFGGVAVLTLCPECCGVIINRQAGASGKAAEPRVQQAAEASSARLRRSRPYIRAIEHGQRSRDAAAASPLHHNVCSIWRAAPHEMQTAIVFLSNWALVGSARGTRTGLAAQTHADVQEAVRPAKLGRQTVQSRIKRRFNALNLHSRAVCPVCRQHLPQEAPK